MLNSFLLSTNSDLPGTLTSSNASLIFSVSNPSSSPTLIAAKALYTLNLPWNFYLYPFISTS